MKSGTWIELNIKSTNFNVKKREEKRRETSLVFFHLFENGISKRGRERERVSDETTLSKHMQLNRTLMPWKSISIHLNIELRMSSIKLSLISHSLALVLSVSLRPVLHLFTHHRIFSDVFFFSLHIPIEEMKRIYSKKIWQASWTSHLSERTNLWSNVKERENFSLPHSSLFSL